MIPLSNRITAAYLASKDLAGLKKLLGRHGVRRGTSLVLASWTVGRLMRQLGKVRTLAHSNTN